MNQKTWTNRMTTTIVMIILAALLASQVLAGCKKDSKAGNGKSQAKGRYAESEMDLPEGAGRPVGILWKDEKLVLYSYQEEGESFQSYTWENAGWSEPQEEKWMADGLERLGQMAIDMRLGGDGKVYAVTQTEAEDQLYGPHLLTDAGDGTALDVTPEAFLKKAGEGFAVGFVDIIVLKDGTIGGSELAGGTTNFYKDNKNVFSAESAVPLSEFQNILAVSGDTIAVLGEDGATICFYAADTFEKKNTVDIEQDVGSDEDIKILAGTDGVWYIVCQKGILRLTEDGSVSETLMDGANGLMSSNAAFLRGFTVGEENGFYGLYSDSTQSYRLMRYAFDEEIPAVQDKALSVYSLQENRTVAQAVYEFQNAHPEVKVEYQFAAGDGESPTADAIRTLNAELLSGSGADVLILDGLPLESYMKKGVLADMSKLVGKLSEEGVITDVIGNTAQMDGKTYGLPARIKVPVIYGSEAEVKACENMAALHAYVSENTDVRLFGRGSHDLIGMTLFHAMYDEISAGEDGLDEEKLTQLLDDWMQICENGGLRDFEEADGTAQEKSVWEALDTNFCSAQEAFGLKRYANINEVCSLSRAGEAYIQAEKAGFAPQTLKNYYSPSAIAGINTASKENELAEEFISCLFSEKVQGNDTWDGFPVLEKSLEDMIAYVDTPEAKEISYGFSTTDPETGEEIYETITYPTKEEMTSFVEMIKGLKTPFISDRIVTDTVLEELQKCYEGTQTTGETAKSICQKVDTYLAE